MSEADDEVRRRRLATVGLTPERVQEMLDEPESRPALEPHELPADDTPGLITGYTDGSFWRNDEHGVAHQVRPPDSERPDAEVHELDQQRRRRQDDE